MALADRIDVLSKVGPGTKTGALFRSVWLPALLASQLPTPGCAPVRIKLLGEELLAFRSGNGELGIVQANCAHRLAPLYYGQIENEGVRCSYHGWLYDKTGQCREMLNETDKTICAKVKIKAYQCVEKADIIWIYMGEGEPPALPKFPWMDLPKEQRNATVWLQESNWLQGIEGELDSSHVSILHTNPATHATSPVHRHYSSTDLSPKIFAKDTSIGVLGIARRNADGNFYWRVSQFMLPAYSSIPAANFPVGGRGYIPIDDYNCYTWDFNYDLKGPLPQALLDMQAKGLVFPPESNYKPYKLNTGSIIDTWVPVRTVANDYLINRGDETLASPSGILGLNDQDRAMQETMLAIEGTDGRITNRSQEFLVAADIVIVRMRRRILLAMETESALAKFRETIEDGSAYNVQPLDIVAEQSEVNSFLETFDEKLIARREAVQ